MPEKISILKESGETLNSNIVSVFMIPDTEKKYMITTENAVDPHGLTVLHVSELVDGTLQKVGTDEEWASIKTIMRAIISGNVGTFQYLPVVESVSASGQYSRDISVSSTAANQMINSYNNGEKNLVNQQAQPEPIQPIQDIGAVNNQVAPVQQPAAQPVDPNQQAVAQQPVAVNPGVVNVGPEMNAQVPPAQPEQVITPGVNPVMQTNPVMPEQPVAPTQVEVSSVAAPVGQPPVQPTSGVGMDQTGAMPVVNNFVPGQGDVVPPVTLDGSIMGDNSAVSGMNSAIPNPTLDNGDSVITPLIVNSEENVTPVQGDPLIPQGQIVLPSDEGAPAQPVQGSFAPDASLDEVVAASQEMFMEGVKNLVQSIQEKVYRDLYIKEEELKKKEEELKAREEALNGMPGAMPNNEPAVPMGVAVPNEPVAPMGMAPMGGMTPMEPMQPMGMAQPMTPPMGMAQPMQPMQPMGNMGMAQPMQPMQPMMGMDPMMGGNMGPMMVSVSNDNPNDDNQGMM